MTSTPPAELVPLAQVHPHPDNARDHTRTQALVDESIDQHGVYKPLVVQRSTGHVLSGNGLLDRMKERGITEAWVWWADVDDAQAQAILLVDNASSDGSGYDDPRLARLLTQVRARQGLVGTGYTEGQVEDLLALLGSAKTPAQLLAEHGDKVADDTFWPQLRIKAPQATLDRWERLAAMTGKTEPADQLQRVLGWAEKGRPKQKRGT